MGPLLRCFAALVFLFSTRLAAAQLAPSDSARWVRVAAVGRLWSNLKLFHPWLATQTTVDWDSVLCADLPAIEQATTPGEYRDGVAQLLDVLHDPLTRLHDSTPETRATGDSSFWRWWGDSVLVIRFADVRVVDGNPLVPLDTLRPLIRSARSVLFDSRADHPGQLEGVATAWSESDLSGALTDTALRTLPQRRRYHVGLKPARDVGSGIYYGEGWQRLEGQIISPDSGNPRRPIAFLTNRDGWLPPVALGLRRAGRALIVGDGGATDNGAVTTLTMQLPEGLSVEIRLGELPGIGNRLGLVADTVLPAGIGQDAGATALALLAKGIKPSLVLSEPVNPEARGPERGYSDHSYPDRQHRLLAGFRIWEVMRYFHAYRELYDDDPDRDLEIMLPRLAEASDSLAYAQAVSRMVVYLRDSHGYVASSALSTWIGRAPAPVQVGMVEGKPVVLALAVDSIARPAGIRVGDVIQTVDGEPALKRFRDRMALMPGSNDAARARNVASTLLNGRDSTTVELRVSGADGRRREIHLPRSQAYRATLSQQRTGDILRILPGNLGYADLDRLASAMVDSMFRMFKDTRGIIFDMRGYPAGTAWTIAPHLTEASQVAAAQFRTPIATQPRGTVEDVLDSEAFEQFTQILPPPEAPWYSRPTVMLINQETQSQAEHTGLFFRSANGTRFVGSQTAGANGDISNFYVPGGILIWFSGHDVRYADGSQLQRVGLKPDVRVEPTIAGLRAGRDEVLERAVRYIKTLR